MGDRNMARRPLPPGLKLALTLCFTAAMVAALLRLVDVGAVGRVLAGADSAWMAAYLSLFLPQVLLAGWRWKRLAAVYGGARLGYGRALAQTLGGYAANLVIPGKLGEMIKAVWLSLGDHGDRVGSGKALAFFLVALEKLLDLGATVAILSGALLWVLPEPLYQPRGVVVLLLAGTGAMWLVAGLLLWRSNWFVAFFNRFLVRSNEAKVLAAWREALGRRREAAELVGWSLALWLVQILQFGCMFRVFGVVVPLREVCAGAPLGLLAGCLPFTVGGVGLRDAALLWYFGPALGMARVFSVGVLSLARVVLPAAAGLPCFLALMRGRRRSSS